MTYTKDDLPDLLLQLKKQLKAAEYTHTINYHKDVYSNSAEREARRIEKLIKLLEHNLIIDDYASGLVLVNDKFVVSLMTNKWRVKNKNKWYTHKSNISHFVDNYVLRE